MKAFIYLELQVEYIFWLDFQFIYVELKVGQHHPIVWLDCQNCSCCISSFLHLP